MPPRDAKKVYANGLTHRQWEYQHRREQILENNAAYTKRNLAKVRAKQGEWHKEDRRQLRDRVLRMYGGKCACCGENERAFLAIDHINGGGTKHIRSFSNCDAYYKWLIELGHRRKGFRVLCHNCNFAEHFCEKGCPHRAAKRS